MECVKAILDQPAMLGLSGLRPALSLAKEQGNSDILALLHEAVVRWVEPVMVRVGSLSSRWHHPFSVQETGTASDSSCV